MSISDKLERILETKELIKNAIENKGVEIDDSTTFRDYASKIEDISSGSEDLTGQQIVQVFGRSYSGKIIDSQGSITYLNPYQFANDYYLTEVSLPECSIFAEYAVSTYSVRGYTFHNCSNLSKVYLPKMDFTSTNSSASTATKMFNYCKNLEDVSLNWSGISYIASEMFRSCIKLSYLGNMENCSGVGQSAFYNCSNLRELGFSNELRVSSSAFYNCSNLERLNNVSYITTIADNAFNNCKKLSGTIHLRNISNLQSSTFQYCSSIEKVIIDRTTMGYFYPYGNYTFYYCTNLKEFEIPSDEFFSAKAWTFGSAVFAQCYKLEKFTIPSNISFATYSGTFNGCSKLSSFEVYDFKNCGTNTFESCIGLSYIKIMKGDKMSIDSSAFKNCYNLESFYFMQESGLSNIPVLSNSNAFYSAGYSTSLGHPMIYVGYEEYAESLKTATNWANISSWIAVSQFESNE